VNAAEAAEAAEATGKGDAHDAAPAESSAPSLAEVTELEAPQAARLPSWKTQLRAVIGEESPARSSRLNDRSISA
jgi:hypothetical protein